MNRILIVTALPQEVPNFTWPLPGTLVFTGVGKVNATYKLTDILTRVNGKKRYDLVINYGTAASKFFKGKLVDCTKFMQRDMDATPLGFGKWETPYDNVNGPLIDFSQSDIKNPLKYNLTCYTGDSFVTDIQDMDVVDMEAYALAKVCRNFGIDFVSYKYISDDGNADDWEKNCGKGVKEFNKLLNEIL